EHARTGETRCVQTARVMCRLYMLCADRTRRVQAAQSACAVCTEHGAVCSRRVRSAHDVYSLHTTCTVCTRRVQSAHSVFRLYVHVQLYKLCAVCPCTYTVR